MWGEWLHDGNGRCSACGATHHTDARRSRIGEEFRCRESIGPVTLDRDVLGCPPKAQSVKQGTWPPLDTLRSGSQRLLGDVNQAKNAQGSVGERGKDFGQSRPLRVVTIFVPPAVFDEVKTVFDLPVAANFGLQFRCRNKSRVDAGHKIPALAGENLTLGRTHFAIDAKGDLAVRKVQTLADILGVVQVEPQPAGFVMEPLFSVTSWAGLDCDASAKHTFNASSTSG